MSATTNLPAKRASFFNDDVLREIVTWDDLGNVVKSNDVLVNNLADYGPGLVVVTNKDTLIGVPMMIVNYRFHEGDNGPFVSAVGITKNPVTVKGSRQARSLSTTAQPAFSRNSKTLSCSASRTAPTKSGRCTARKVFANPNTSARTPTARPS